MSKDAIAPATETVVGSAPVAPSTGDQPGSTPAPADTAASEQAEPAGETPEQKQSRRDSKAFATLRRENRELNRALGRMEAMIEANRSQQPTADGEPAPQARPEEIAARQADAEAIQTAVERLEEAGEDIEGFDKVMQDLRNPAKTKVSSTMRDYFTVSDQPAQLAQWLVKNPEESARIARLSGAVAVKALEKVEAQLATKAPPKRTTGAPPPVSTVGGSSTATFNPEKAGMDDFVEWRKRQKT